MPDLGHLKKLQEGARAWNAWRAQYPSVVPNLTGAVLTVGERQMGIVNGGPINLRSALLQGADFRFATLSGADLGQAKLSGADLTEARLDGADMTAADLSNAILERVDLTDAILARANFAGTSLRGARHLTQAQLGQAAGDARTILPDGLARPSHWSRSDSRPEPKELLPGPAGISTVSASWDEQQQRLAVSLDAMRDASLRRGARRGKSIAPLEPLAPLDVMEAGPGLELDPRRDDLATTWRTRGRPRAVGRRLLPTSAFIGLAFIIVGLAWYVASTLVDVRLTIQSAPLAPSVPPDGVQEIGTPQFVRDYSDTGKPITSEERQDALAPPRDAAKATQASPPSLARSVPSTAFGNVGLETSALPEVKAPDVDAVAPAPPSGRSSKGQAAPGGPSPVAKGRAARPKSNPAKAAASQPAARPKDNPVKATRPVRAASTKRDAAAEILSGGLQ